MFSDFGDDYCIVGRHLQCVWYPLIQCSGIMILLEVLCAMLGSICVASHFWRSAAVLMICACADLRRKSVPHMRVPKNRTFTDSKTFIVLIFSTFLGKEGGENFVTKIYGWLRWICMVHPTSRLPPLCCEQWATEEEEGRRQNSKPVSCFDSTKLCGALIRSKLGPRMLWCSRRGGVFRLVCDIAQ